jgi:CRISPR-associated protein Csm1
MDQTLAELAVGAFLHDIGKIGQRARNKLTEQSEGLKPSICPTTSYGGYGWLHTPHTSQFFEQNQGWLPAQFKTLAQAANFASYHHKPRQDEILDLIVQQSDWISAGHDRNQDLEIEKDDQYIKGRLASIFNNISFDNAAPSSGNTWQYRISKIDLGEKCFPAKEFGDIITENKETYEAMTLHFEQLKDSAKLPLNVFCQHLAWVFGQYAWCVPSSLVNTADVSLLDHSLTTAAFATALYKFHTETDSLKTGSISDKSLEKFRFVCGDVSGIQDFIFHDSLRKPRGVSKRLRAKSFYIGVLSQVASLMILEKLELPCFNRIMDAGGRFTLLVHNTDSCLDTLKRLQKEIDGWMLDQFQGRLRINLSFETVCSGSDFLDSDKYQELMRKFANDSEAVKKRPLASVLTDKQGWNCNSMVKKPQHVKPEDQIDIEEEFFRKLGEVLPKSPHLVVTDKNANNPGRLDSESPWRMLFDRYSFNIADCDNEKYKAGKKDDDLKARYRFVPGQGEWVNCVDGLYMANYVPMNQDNTVMEFEAIARQAISQDKAGGKKGVPMLGVLKADVDNLGLIFNKGLNGRSTIARTATLSRMIDMFFKGILPNAVKTNPDYKNIYTIYAGGDDLLLVGDWKSIVHFADFMRDKFRLYTCSNPALTISAGIVMIKPHSPLCEAARAAEEALEQSKRFIDKDKDEKMPRKDRITIFSETLDWADYKEAVKNADWIDGHLENSINPESKSLKITSSFAYRFIKYARMGLRCTKSSTPNLTDAKWKSQLAYDIARNIKEDNKNINPQAMEDLIKITGDNNIKKLYISATILNYKNRRL